MMDYHSLFKSARNATYRHFGGILKVVKLGKNNLKFSQILNEFDNSNILHMNGIRVSVVHVVYTVAPPVVLVAF